MTIDAGLLNQLEEDKWAQQTLAESGQELQVRAIERCSDARDLDLVMRALDDDENDIIWLAPRGATALLEKLESWEDEEGLVAGLVWLGSVISKEEWLFRPHIAEDLWPPVPFPGALPSPAFPGALRVEQEIGHIRRFCRSRSPTVRTAAVHLLARCRTSSVEDLELFRELLSSEENDVAVCTLLISLGAVSYRLNDPTPFAGELCRNVLNCQEAPGRFDWPRFGAAIGSAFLDPHLSVMAAQMLIAAARSPVQLPDAWGWPRFEKSDSLVLVSRIAQWTSFPESASKLLLPLTGAMLDPDREEWGRDICAAALRLVFGEIPSWFKKDGLARSELNESQLFVLDTLSQSAWKYCYCVRDLGFFSRKSLESFLKGEEPIWVDTPVVIDGRVCLWPSVKIIGRVCAGGLSPEAAGRAIAASHPLSSCCNISLEFHLEIDGRFRGVKNDQAILAVAQNIFRSHPSGREAAQSALQAWPVRSDWQLERKEVILSSLG